MSESVATRRYKYKQRRREMEKKYLRAKGFLGWLEGPIRQNRTRPIIDLSALVTRAEKEST